MSTNFALSLNLALSSNLALSFGPLDAATGTAYMLLTHLTTALTPIGGGVAAALAVVLLTASVRLLLVPVAIRQAAAQRRQAALAPRLKELRTKHAADPARLTTEMAALYQQENVSPFGGLLLGLLQAPVFMVLWLAFTQSTVDGQANALLVAEVLGVPLGAAGLAVGWLLPVLLAAIALVATVTARRIRRSEAPSWLAALPYLTLVPAATMPLAAGLYLLTTTTWSAAETAILRRG